MTTTEGNMVRNFTSFLWLVSECVHATTIFCRVSDSHWFDYLHNKHVLGNKKVCLVHVGKKEHLNYKIKKLCRHASCAWSSHIESAPLLSTAS